MAAPTRRRVHGPAGFVLLLASAVQVSAAYASPPPRRIITIAPNAAEIICQLGACDRIVGVTKFCTDPPELKKRPRVGGFIDPDLERIAALRPDLIVLRGRSEPIEALCRRNGIDLYADSADSIRGIEQTTMDLGRRLGAEDRATKIVRRMRKQIDAIRARVAGRPRPRVFLTVSRRPDALTDLLTAGRGTFLYELVEIAGGANVFADVDMRYPKVSVEAVLARRPDVILEFLPELDVTAPLKRAMRDQWRRLGSIPAATAGRIYFITDDNTLIPSPRVVGVIDKVSRILHPEGGVD